MYGVVYGDDQLVALFNSVDRAERYIDRRFKLFGLYPRIKTFIVNYERSFKQCDQQGSQIEREAI